MIDRTEVLAVATELGLDPQVVEKDYVLGWILAGIYAHEKLSGAWIFKGGTCLKKCFFETYRFSEDLDFTVTDATHLEAGFLGEAFGAVAEWVYDKAGIELPKDQMRFEIYRNKRDGLSAEGRLYYSGPLQPGGSLPRIKLDLTVDELLVLPPVDREVGHPYRDSPEGGIVARCYAYEEIFAEKVRALGERTRPRDLYDVVNLFRHDEFRPAAAEVLHVLQRKCHFKEIAVPTLAGLAGATAELTADWSQMLSHQLPALPPFEAFWNVLPEFFGWLASAVSPAPLAAAPLAAGEAIFRPAVGMLRREGIAGSTFLERVRFAAASRLCADLGYQGSVRRIEPYSLRRTKAGDILLYAVRSTSGELRSYRLDRIEAVRMTDQTFAPRFAVELAPMGHSAILPTARGGAAPGVSGRVSRSGSSSRRRGRTGPTYVYQCGACGKKFTHSRQNPRLGAHKAPGGWPCASRTGFFVATRF